jgi:hypothetical protein
MTTTMTTEPTTIRELTDEDLARLYEGLGVAPHPMLPLPNAARAQLCLATPARRQQFSEWLRRRQQRIILAEHPNEGDPLNYGWEFEPWEDADRLLKDPANHILALFGQNRCTKTWYAVKRALQVAKWYPESVVVIASEKDETSVTNIQSKIVWDVYFKREYWRVNGKRDVKQRLAINYGQKNGFTDGKMVLENGSEIYFLSYVTNATDYEGWEFGARQDIYEKISAERRAQGLFVPPNVGFVADESMPLSWLKMAERRVRWRGAKLVWSFTPIKGITPAMKELVGAGARTVQSKPSELLPGQNLADCPPGHMPYIRHCTYPGAVAIYFYGNFNPIGPSPGRTYYDAVKESCTGKTTEYIERIAYGFARDSIARAFPNFGPHNVVRRRQIPGKGTNYLFMDPHGTRNWPMLWVRVVPTRPVSLYIYREWPDLPTYGEWAVATEREVNEQQRKGWDGDPGPAQAGLGWGVTQYKQEILRQERVIVPKQLTEHEGMWAEADVAKGLAALPDQNHQLRIRQAWRAGEPLENLREEIAARYGDPRGIHNPHVTESGGTTIFAEFEKQQVDPKSGQVIVPAMELWDAPTSRRINPEEADEGITQVNELLGCANHPANGGTYLFVCDECRQTIWMFENYTGRSGGTGASKDFADLVKYICLAELEYLEVIHSKGKPGRGH